MKNKVIRWLGGYASIDDAINAIKEKDLDEKYTILTLAVKKLFNTIGPDDILRVNSSGQWMYQNKTLNEAHRKLLEAEAKQFTETTLWKILQDDIKWQANKKMFILAENEVQVAAGKFWIYTLDCIRTRLKSLAKGSANFNEPRSR